MALTKSDVQVLKHQLKHLKLETVKDMFSRMAQNPHPTMIQYHSADGTQLNIGLSVGQEQDMAFLTCCTKDAPVAGAVTLRPENNAGLMINMVKQAFLEHVMCMQTLTLEIEHN